MNSTLDAARAQAHSNRADHHEEVGHNVRVTTEVWAHGEVEGSAYCHNCAMDVRLPCADEIFDL
jgi:hypothetical protein